MLRLLAAQPAGEVLDVGAGSGFFSRLLLDRTQATGAVCVDPNYPRAHEEVQNGKPIRFVQSIGQFGGKLVLLMDVLEHVQDDLALLSDYVAKAAPGTCFLITVPAHQWLWSGHDVFLEHYRRYTLKQLTRVVAGAGLSLEKGAYFYGAVLPIAAALRLGTRALRLEKPGSQMHRHSKLVNRLLLTLTQAELPFLGRNKLSGLTVFALARK